MGTKSTHILSTSSNLLGFAFIVLTSIRSFGLPEASFIDEFVAVLIVVLALSCASSFVSLRSVNSRTAERYECYADYLFLLALGIIVALSITISFDVLFFLR